MGCLTLRFVPFVSLCIDSDQKMGSRWVVLRALGLHSAVLPVASEGSRGSDCVSWAAFLSPAKCCGSLGSAFLLALCGSLGLYFHSHTFSFALTLFLIPYCFAWLSSPFFYKPPLKWCGLVLCDSQLEHFFRPVP